MKNLKTFSLAITMLISFLSFGQNSSKSDSNQVVKSRELSVDSKTDISQSLIKNVSGLQIRNTNNGSKPTSRIVFRCKRDSTAEKLALIIIDDKIATIDEFTKLEPKYVDNVSVIKGVEGAKLYGVNGANGVIVVKTKLDTNQRDPIVFKKTSIKVDGNNENCKSFIENVVGAMGIVKKKDAQTYSTQIVKSKELTQSANPNIAQSLIGKVSGLQINTTDNSVNPTSRIIIRGNRSISGNNEALIIIDNVISTIDIFTALAPETVDSIYVIKGAQGAALYGMYGANGVIMVRTKLEFDEENSIEQSESIFKDVPSVVVNYPNKTF